MSAVSSGDKSFYMIEAVSDRLEGAPLQSRRRWSDEFKARAVARSFAPDTNISSVARDVGVAPSQLFDWRRKALRDGTVKMKTTPTKLADVRTELSPCFWLNELSILIIGMNQPIANYKNHRFPPEIIARAVWLYYRFPLSLRHIEEMLLERGIAVSYETIRRWGRKHGPDYVRRIRRKSPSSSDIWHLDEVAVASMASDAGCGGRSIKMVVFLTRSCRTAATPRLPDVC
jgi:putative transposase